MASDAPGTRLVVAIEDHQPHARPRQQKFLESPRQFPCAHPTRIVDEVRVDHATVAVILVAK